ncbi:ABC transporter permease [Mucilaginibacter sp. UYCu711]|uniref:ABC transporter permease n=1 Tax=Mucilaginibacter sp. UYCu711 TaxID=3156339 RepID=UPI003D200050
MFKHLFKLIWNKKKQNALLITEMLVSFMVMFAVFSMIVNFYQNYRTPLGFEYKNVWLINIDNSPHFNRGDSAAMYYENIRKVLTNMPEVKEVSFASGNTPFTSSMMTTGYRHKGKLYSPINFYRTEDAYDNAFDLHLLEGRWFEKQDDAAVTTPVVINQSFKEQMFGKGKATGQLIGGYDEKDPKKMRIIGVIADMKDRGDYRPSGQSLYTRIDTGFFHYVSRIVIKVTPEADAAFEGRLYKAVANIMKESTVGIERFSQKRDKMNKETLMPVIILLILATFLIINVALGLFGVLWYNINKRRGEIGLRRAIGATGNSVAAQIVTESVLLATLSLIIGSFFAVQFPLLNVFGLPAGVYFTAIFLAALFIYLLVLVCSLYPGRQAAAVYPAVALHEE